MEPNKLQRKILFEMDGVAVYYAPMTGVETRAFLAAIKASNEKYKDNHPELLRAMRDLQFKVAADCLNHIDAAAEWTAETLETSTDEVFITGLVAHILASNGIKFTAA